MIGNSSIESIGGYVNWTASSDGRYKSNVEENVIGLDFIEMLRPVTYSYDVEAIEALHGRELPSRLKRLAEQKSDVRYTGFIAQEVEQAANESVVSSGVDAPSSDKEGYGLRYAEFVEQGKATQELNDKIEINKSLLMHRQQCWRNMKLRSIE